MGLDFVDAEETPLEQVLPKCDKCKTILKANNQFSVDDSKTLCGQCRTEYQAYIRKFYNPQVTKIG